MKKITINQFLTPEEIRLCSKLGTARKICEAVTKPNIKRINENLGQENDPMFLAYAVEYALTAVKDKDDRGHETRRDIAQN